MGEIAIRVLSRVARVVGACAILGGLTTLPGAQSPTGKLDWAQLPNQKFDVVVIGGSISGIGAAVGAGRMGVTVALIEDTPVLGGMVANGIGNTDSYSVEAMSGIFREFTDAVKRHYQPIMATDPLFKLHIRRYLPPALAGIRAPIETEKNLTTSGVMDPDEGGRWEPHVADQIFKRMAAELPNVKIFYKRHAAHVIKEGNRIIGVVTYASARPNAYAPAEPGTGLVFYGNVFIDATHEGDIAAWAGAPYRVGREPRSRLEPHAGSIYFFNRTGEILPGSTGQGDRAVVSYGLRITLKNYSDKDARSHVLPSPPPGYDKKHYEHSSYTGRTYNPNGKAEVNLYPFGNEIQEVNWNWPEANREERERLYELYKNRALGFLYYLQHEKGLTHLGLPADDYTDNGNVPYRLYVREARRIMGQYIMTEADINPFVTGRTLIQPIKEDAVAVGHYPIDVKPSYRKTDLSMPDKGNGDMYITNVTQPFQVPYRALLPEGVDGLLVATAISATHIAYSAIRLDPTWAVMGQAAGIAAALSVQQDLEVRAVPVRLIQRELLKQKCELMFYWDLPLDHPAFRAVQWLSVHKVVRGYPDRLFRPDQSLTRAEMAALLVNALDLWPSVSNVHFTDVPDDHWAFREIESLYDNQALEAFGIKPLWPKYGSWDDQVRSNQGYGQNQKFLPFFPSKPVTWQEFLAVIRSAQKRRTMSPSEEGQLAVTGPLEGSISWVKEVLSGSMFGTEYAKKQFRPDEPVTRGEACALIASLSDKIARGKK